MIYLLARSFYEKDEQDWKTLTTYHAKTTIQEKVYRLANGIVFGTALYGACASLTGPVALLSYAAKGSDKVIPDAVSLAHEVHQEEGLSNKIFLESDKVVHNGELPDDIERRLKQELDRFFQNK